MQPPAQEPAAAPWSDPNLEAWLAKAGSDPLTLDPLPGDVSPRRYARLADGRGGSAIVAAYPADILPVLERFVASTTLLAGAGVRVPRILAVESQRGWVLQEDLGRETLYDWRERSWSELSPWLDAAAQTVATIASLPLAAVSALGSPPLDTALLIRELEVTFDVLLRPRCLVEPAEEGAVRAVLVTLCERLGARTPVACHRDFMARNLVPLAGGVVGVLDHQDLRSGPRGYDLASLANDSLFVPAPIAGRWLDRSQVTAEDRLDYHRAATQRGLKAAGTFARFAQRGVPRHLPLVRPTLLRALEHLAETPEGGGLAADLAPRWERMLAEGLC